MQNGLSDLNNRLFTLLDDLLDDEITPEKEEMLCKKAKVVCDVSSQIIDVANTQINAIRVAGEYGYKNTELPQLIAIKDAKKRIPEDV